MSSFAVLGDTHLVREESHRAVLGGQPGGWTELADLERNGWMTRHVFPRVLEAVAAQKPDFLIHTGDIIPGHGDTDDDQLAEMRQALALLRTLGVPLFFSCGSHDGVRGRRGEVALTQCLYPYLSEQLGRPCEQGTYAFVREDCLFVSADYMTWDAPQRRSVEQALEKEGDGRFVIVFGHPPVVPLARPFFTKEPYAREMGELFARYRVHAYFCGHTHNHTASLHRFGGHETAQLASTPLGYPDRPPTRLSDVRPILPAADTCAYGWGFLEDAMPGWWRVTVEADALLAQWFVLDRGLQGALRIPRQGRAAFIQTPSCPTTRGSLPDLGQVERARLRVAGSGQPNVPLDGLVLNGRRVDVGQELVYFDSRQFVEIPPPLVSLLRPVNEITFSLPESGGTVGGWVLELTLRDGSTVRSEVSPYYTADARYHAADPAHFILTGREPVTVKLSF